MSLRIISKTAIPLLIAFAIALPAGAESNDPHHDDQQTQGTPQLPGSPMGGGMLGNNPAGMAGMMQMMQMMQSSQMMQMAQMMQMMQMMQSLQAPEDRSGGGMGMGGGMPMLGAPAAPIGNVETALAYYKTAIGITDSQTAAWTAFADALRDAARQLQGVRQSGNAPVTALDQLTRKSAILEAEVAVIRRIDPSARALYAVLSPEQKRAADLLMTDHLSRM